MTSITPISDGQPVTYELINQIIGSINNLSKSTSEAGTERIIEVFGPNISQTNNVQLFIGEFFINFGSIKNAKESTATAEVEFGKKPFSALPYVIMSVVDPSNETNSEISYVSLTAINITKSGYTCKARRMVSGKDNRNKDKLKVNFIAIGPLSPTAS
jgi:hypothetical protein